MPAPGAAFRTEINVKINSISVFLESHERPHEGGGGIFQFICIYIAGGAPIIANI